MECFKKDRQLQVDLSKHVVFTSLEFFKCRSKCGEILRKLTISKFIYVSRHIFWVDMKLNICGSSFDCCNIFLFSNAHWYVEVLTPMQRNGSNISEMDTIHRFEGQWSRSFHNLNLLRMKLVCRGRNLCRWWIILSADVISCRDDDLF